MYNRIRNKIKEKVFIWEKLLHFISSGKTGVYSSASPENKPNISFKVAYFIYRFFLFPVRLIFRKRTTERKEIHKKPVWFVYGSINDYNALFPVFNPEDSIYIWPNKDVIYRRIIIYKIVWVFPVLVWLMKKNRMRFFVRYYDVLGLYEESLRILERYNPKRLVFSCDHVPIQIALKMAAMNLGIETFYFQHGAITKAFPPLEFTVSFLDGRDAFEKYKNIGKIKGKVELIGNLKSRKNNHIRNTNKFVNTIGIAINRNNSIKDLLILVKKIKENFPEIKIIVRNHPADKRKIKKEKLFLVSDSLNENVFNFLSKIDLLIATNSSIHLEAVLQNIPSIYYRISEYNFLDSHGFVKNGLVDYAGSFSELSALLKRYIHEKPNVIQRASYYDEFINSSCDYVGILAKYGFKVNEEYRVNKNQIIDNKDLIKKND